MKLELDDILTRVSRTEDDRAEYVRMAESWEKMWRMEVFSKSAEAAIAQDGQEQITLPTGYNIIQLASRLIGNKPGIDVPPLDVTKDADEAAESCERWLVAMFQAVNRQQERNIIDDAKFWTFLRGRNVFEVKWVEDELPVMLKKTRLPILIRTLDPLNVGVKRGPLYTHWAYHKYETEVLDAKQRYPDLKRWKKKTRISPRNKASNDEGETVTIIDYWQTDVMTGKIWNGIIVEDEWSKELEETAYPAIPIIESYGDTSPLDKEEYKGISILHPIKDLYRYQCRLLSQIATGLLYYFWPAVLVQNEHGAVVEDFKIQPGETNYLPWGTKVDAFKTDPNVPLAQTMQTQIEQAAQQSTFPQVLYGQSPGDVQAGFSVNNLAEAAKGRIKPSLDNLEFALARVCELVFALIKEFGDKDGIDVWGMDERSAKPYRLKLSKKDIGDTSEVSVSLKPQVPQDQMQMLVMALQLVDKGIISEQTFRDRFLHIAVPSDEQKRVEIQAALKSDQMRPYVFAAAMEQYSGPDWNQYLQSPPPAPFGPPPGPPPGAPGPQGPGGPPPMGPGGPPMQGPPPGPGGPPPGPMGPPPPQGPPPEMMGPPPGAPMPPQGPPPPPPGPSPDAPMLQQIVQMLQQMEQLILGGAGGPPGMPPEMMGGPGGPPPGQPGAPPPGMPPGGPGGPMIPQALTPPSGGGIPAEMQNQLTPEGLGMPANTDPLTFAGMTGREIPEADKLKIIAGQRNVGNKSERKGR